MWRLTLRLVLLEMRMMMLMLTSKTLALSNPQY